MFSEILNFKIVRDRTNYDNKTSKELKEFGIKDNNLFWSFGVYAYFGIGLAILFATYLLLKIF